MYDIFRGRRILVTGHTGFKGSWLCLWLSSLNAKVSGLALPPPDDRPSMFKLLNLEGATDSHFIDIRERQRTIDTIRRLEPEIVFHLAAQPIVRESYAMPSKTFMTNVMGTVHVLDAVRKTPSVKATIIVTSDKCYENMEWVWGYRESDQLGGHDPYSASKGAAEIVTASYRRSFPELEQTLASARAGNVIGGGDWASDRLIPDIVRAILAKERVRIRNPSSRRPWQHVLEPLGGYMLIASKLIGQDGGRFAEAWNLGPQFNEHTRTVNEVADLFASAWGVSPENLLDYDAPGDTNRHEATTLALDSSKARTFLGWKPLFSTLEAVEMSAQWYRTFATNPMDLMKTTQDQIAIYTNRCREQND